MEQELFNVVNNVVGLVLYRVLLKSILDAAHVLDEDVVSSDYHFLLLLFLLAWLGRCRINPTGRLLLSLGWLLIRIRFESLLGGESAVAA